MKTYPIAPHGIFWSIQGEGALAGQPTVFVRLAGCSVGCEQCDTDYRVDRRLSPRQIAQEVANLIPTGATSQWVWITGGEPADHDLLALVGALQMVPGVRVALATSGHKPIPPIPSMWISVSPHNADKWVVREGHEVKLVPGLNGLRLEDFEDLFATPPVPQFSYHYVQPLWDSRTGAPDKNSVSQCLAWVRKYPYWRLSTQQHKAVMLP